MKRKEGRINVLQVYNDLGLYGAFFFFVSSNSFDRVLILTCIIVKITDYHLGLWMHPVFCTS
jgi:hypothetical protein